MRSPEKLIWYRGSSWDFSQSFIFIRDVTVRSLILFLLSVLIFFNVLNNRPAMALLTGKEYRRLATLTSEGKRNLLRFLLVPKLLSNNQDSPADTCQSFRLPKKHIISTFCVLSTGHLTFGLNVFLQDWKSCYNRGMRNMNFIITSFWFKDVDERKNVVFKRKTSLDLGDGSFFKVFTSNIKLLNLSLCI